MPRIIIRLNIQNNVLSHRVRVHAIPFAVPVCVHYLILCVRVCVATRFSFSHTPKIANTLFDNRPLAPAERCARIQGRHDQHRCDRAGSAGELLYLSTHIGGGRGRSRQWSAYEPAAEAWLRPV